MSLDQVQAAKPSTLDISYHQLGAWSSLPPGKPWPSPSVPGYKYIQQATTRTVGEDGLVLKTSVLDDWQPAIVLADEPTSMLDVSIRIGILNLMLKLKEEHETALGPSRRGRGLLLINRLSNRVEYQFQGGTRAEAVIER